MNMMWIIYSSFLVLVPLINGLPLIPSLNLKQILQNLTIPNNSLGNTDKDKILSVCQEIETNISGNSQVFYFYDLRYYEGISHYGTTSTMFPVCSVEPAATADVAIIMKIIRKNRVPFAVKSGGHSLNPGFSSTEGVHIALRRFRKTVFHSNNQTVDVGPGLTWDGVYEALEPYNISVLGGRVTGVGVGGFALGGGYGWKSNQYGLTIDNIYEYELVTPNGTIVYVNKESYPDIFFGLKGGLNNFGIVTNFNMRALPQTQVYGGILYYTAFELDELLTAVMNFQNNNRDPKAQIISSITAMDGVLIPNTIIFYDAPTAPQNVFKEFIDIPHIGILKTQSYLSLVKASPILTTDNMRGRFHTISITNFTNGFLNKMKELAIIYSIKLLTMAGTFLTFGMEPFVPSYFDNGLDGAYPHAPSSTPLLPLVIQFGWQLPINDALFVNEIQEVADYLLQAAIDDGQDIGGAKQIRYPNYAIKNTSLSEIYGSNLQRLKIIRQAWDLEDVMYLTEGFKF